MSDQRYDLDELNWVDPPSEYNFFGSVVYLYPEDENRDVDIFVEYNPASGDAVLSSKINLSPVEDLVEWAVSDNFHDWGILDKLFGKNWKKWLKKQSKELKELYEEEENENN